MPKLFIRLVALLLVPCLIADPVTASTFYQANFSPAKSIIQNDVFTQQAFVSRLIVSPWKTFSKRWRSAYLRDAKQHIPLTPAPALLFLTFFLGAAAVAPGQVLPTQGSRLPSAGEFQQLATDQQDPLRKQIVQWLTQGDSSKEQSASTAAREWGDQRLLANLLSITEDESLPLDERERARHLLPKLMGDVSGSNYDARLPSPNNIPLLVHTYQNNPFDDLVESAALAMAELSSEGIEVDLIEHVLRMGLTQGGHHQIVAAVVALEQVEIVDWIELVKNRLKKENDPEAEKAFITLLEQVDGMDDVIRPLLKDVLKEVQEEKTQTIVHVSPLSLTRGWLVALLLLPFVLANANFGRPRWNPPIEELTKAWEPYSGVQALGTLAKATGTWKKSIAFKVLDKLLVQVNAALLRKDPRRMPIFLKKDTRLAIQYALRLCNADSSVLAQVLRLTGLSDHTVSIYGFTKLREEESKRREIEGLPPLKRPGSDGLRAGGKPRWNPPIEQLAEAWEPFQGVQSLAVLADAAHISLTTLRSRVDALLIQVNQFLLRKDPQRMLIYLSKDTAGAIRNALRLCKEGSFADQQVLELTGVSEDTLKKYGYREHYEQENKRRQDEGLPLLPSNNKSRSDDRTDAEIIAQLVEVTVTGLPELPVPLKDVLERLSQNQKFAEQPIRQVSLNGTLQRPLNLESQTPVSKKDDLLVYVKRLKKLLTVLFLSLMLPALAGAQILAPSSLAGSPAQHSGAVELKPEDPEWIQDARIQEVLRQDAKALNDQLKIVEQEFNKAHRNAAGQTTVPRDTPKALTGLLTLGLISTAVLLAAIAGLWWYSRKKPGKPDVSKLQAREALQRRFEQAKKRIIHPGPHEEPPDTTIYRRLWHLIKDKSKPGDDVMIWVLTIGLVGAHFFPGWIGITAIGSLAMAHVRKPPLSAWSINSHADELKANFELEMRRRAAAHMADWTVFSRVAWLFAESSRLASESILSYTLAQAAEIIQVKPGDFIEPRARLEIAGLMAPVTGHNRSADPTWHRIHDAETLRAYGSVAAPLQGRIRGVVNGLHARLATHSGKKLAVFLMALGAAGMGLNMAAPWIGIAHDVGLGLFILGTGLAVFGRSKTRRHTTELLRAA